jgi:hypothetical protein
MERKPCNERKQEGCQNDSSTQEIVAVLFDELLDRFHLDSPFYG